MAENDSNYLFSKQRMPGKWIFLLAAIPLGFTALVGYEYGAFYFYLVPTLLCLIQFFYPTRFLWGCFFGLFTLAAIAYTLLFAADIIRILAGGRPEQFVDMDDSIVILMFWSMLVFVAVFLGYHRPVPLHPSDEGPSDEEPATPND